MLLLAVFDFSSDCMTCGIHVDWMTVTHLVLDVSSIISAISKTSLLLEKSSPLAEKVNNYVNGYYKVLVKKHAKIISECEVGLGTLGSSLVFRH